MAQVLINSPKKKQTFAGIEQNEENALRSPRIPEGGFWRSGFLPERCCLGRISARTEESLIS